MKNKKITILGAGPGGYVAAVRAARLGCSVTVIERDGPGGVCLRHGCIPVKALLRSARAYDMALGASDFGVNCAGVDFDFDTMMTRKDDIVTRNVQGIEGLFKRHDIRYIRGAGTFVSPSEISVTDNHGSATSVQSDAFIITTGSSSVVPDFVAFDRKRIFDSEGALALYELPKSCIILGGGVLGCEFASLFGSLGVHVTLIEMMPSLLPSWDSELSRMVVRSFKRKQIGVKTNTAVESVRVNPDSGEVEVTLSTGEINTAKCCLVALGRSPNVADIGLEQAGVQLWQDGRPGIQVDEFMRTSAPNIYAAGDVTGLRLLAHVASQQGIVAVDHLCGGESSATPIRYDAVPDCFWATPELASVGITESDAEEKSLDVSVGKAYFRSLGIAHALGAIDGFVRVVAEKGTGKVLGIHIAGQSAPDMIAEASVIVANGLTVSHIENTIHAHPTMGEIVKEAVLAAQGKNIHG